MKSQPVPIVQFMLQKTFLILPVLALCLAGCASTDKGVMDPPGADDTNEVAAARLHVGDSVTVIFDGLPEAIAPHEETIKEDGTITLQDVGAVKAAGKTTGELQNIIHDLYVPRLYTHLTVTVKAGDRVFYVRGEVNSKGRQIYVGQITVTKAITSAGDFTDYANHRNVLLIRANGKRYVINCNAILDGEAPDPGVYPGDQIEVRRRRF